MHIAKKQRLMQKITHKQVMFVCDFFLPDALA